ncbi:MAG: 4-hydroxy-3-methylbut-2-enyl diphosphate reductase [Verrucomicrobiales bacterium]|nr:4-hydroxy-3-methylbut-2-enyl diphosphate reductase [Verrucomicrobiales bacterium]
MIIQRALHLGMCFGVRDAIHLAQSQAESQPITVLGDLVHNETVLSDLRARGVQVERHLDAVRTSTVVITAHGASHQRLEAVRQRGFHLIEATCPLVRFAHQQLHRLVHEGFHPVIVGIRDHAEVRGLTEDLDAVDVVLNESDVDQLLPRPRFGVIAQTTQPVVRVNRLVHRLRHRFPAATVRLLDTVCMPTKQRQQAATRLALDSDVVVVIGGAHSNNTRELVETCRTGCPRVHHIQTAADLRPEWFLPSDHVGLTAGTSTPDSAIDDAEAWLRDLSERFTPSPRATRAQPQAAEVQP